MWAWIIEHFWLMAITIIIVTWIICGLLRGSKSYDDAYNEAQMKENYDKFLKKEGIDRD